MTRVLPDFDSMNETDVRETVVRPFLESLGYQHGTQAAIRSEVPLRYNKAFLGRKKPAKDPALGKADYVCEAVGYGRWIVEVKSPSREIGRDDVEQAHTYAAHPEIAALYFLVTNGREFNLYMTSRLKAPLLSWAYEEIEDLHSQICGVLEFEAIKKYASRVTPDVGRPLAKGLPSKLEVRGGEVIYGPHESDHPLLQNDVLNDSVAPITEGWVARQEDGRIQAKLRVITAAGSTRKLNERLGLDRFEFVANAQELSQDHELPTIFKNIQVGEIQEGEIISVPQFGEIPMPFRISFEVFSEAFGFLEDGIFKGIISFDYNFEFHSPSSNPNPMIAMLVSSVPRTGKLTGSGEFSIRFADS